MSYTAEDFKRDYAKEYFPMLTMEEKREILMSLPLEERLAILPLEERLAGLSEEQIQKYLERMKSNAAAPRKPRRKR